MCERGEEIFVASGSWQALGTALRLGDSSHDLNLTRHRHDIAGRRRLLLISLALSMMIFSRAFRSAVVLSSRSSPVTTRQCLRIVSVLPQQQRLYAAVPTPTHELKTTPLNNLHISNGARMVRFAGYSMPVLYSDQGVGDSHKFVREKAGLFDVSHMVQHRLTGPGALAFLHSVTPSDLLKLSPGQSTLSVLLHPVTGGIVDDLIITLENPDNFYVVTNAACKEKDIEYIRTNIAKFDESSNGKVTHEVLGNHGLIALQGPLANVILQEYIDSTPARGKLDLKTLYFGFATYLDIPLGLGNVETLHIARGGYTGEDGFEIAISAKNAEAVTQAILDIGARGDRIKLTGLGARDSLRLEAGMCLYGHDIDDTTTPIEAGLKWLIGKQRIMSSNFNGAEIVARQYGDWKLVERRRVGFFVDGAPAREGAEVVDKGTDTVIGKITSGCPSPTLGRNIAMGYVKSGFHKAGTPVGVKVRGKVRDGVVAKMPFVEAKYYKN